MLTSLPVQSGEEYIIPWRVQPYGPVTIVQGESLVFAWDDFHSLHQVRPSAHEVGIIWGCCVVKESYLMHLKVVILGCIIYLVQYCVTICLTRSLDIID